MNRPDSTQWELLEAVPDAMFVVGRDGRIAFVNQRALGVFGYASAELLGRSIEAVIPARFRGGHGQRLGDYFAQPHPRPMGADRDLLALRRDGTELPVEITLTTVQTPQGPVAVAAVRDVSDRRRAEQVLRETEARYRGVLDQMLEAVQILSFDWRYLYLNDAAVRNSHQSREEMLGRTVMERYPGLEGTEMFAVMRQCMEDRATRVREFDFTYPDGTRAWFKFSIQPVPEGLFILALDITARVQADLAMRALNVELEQRVKERTVELGEANRELESFSYSVAHDLRAPLRSIDGFSQALLEDCGEQLDATGKKHLGFVRQSAQLMAQLIDDMLTLSRVSRAELTRVEVNLTELFRAAHARLQRAEPARQVEVVVQDGLCGYGDPRLLAVVIDNLLANAWKFTSKKQNSRIEFGAAPRDGRRAYFVRDNGAGFDMAYAGKLFGVFQRLHAAHEFEGTGVGLATVQRIVHRHGGQVWAQGQVDAGAVVSFTLPDKEHTA